MQILPSLARGTTYRGYIPTAPSSSRKLANNLGPDNRGDNVSRWKILTGRDKFDQYVSYNDLEYVTGELGSVTLTII
jgi:hypothetical protein